MVAGDPDHAFGLGVVGLHLVVVDGPVDDVRALDRTELGPGAEVDLAEARQLAVGVEAAAADGRGQVVHAPGEDPVAFGGAAAERPRFEERVGPEEVAEHQLELVVADMPERTERRIEREQVVRSLLEHDHRPPGRGEHLRDRRAGRPRPHDHGVAVELGHGLATSASV